MCGVCVSYCEWLYLSLPLFVFVVTALLVWGVCVCDGGVLLRDSGDGLCGVEGRVV